MIVTGAENVYPVEVESALSEHPDVADVAVIGVPDETLGRDGEGCRRTPAGVRRSPRTSCSPGRKDRIAGFKRPRSVDFVDELPRNPSGKLLKRVLREPYWGDARAAASAERAATVYQGMPRNFRPMEVFRDDLLHGEHHAPVNPVVASRRTPASPRPRRRCAAGSSARCARARALPEVAQGRRVDGLLGSGIGQRRSGGEPGDDVLDHLLELLVGYDVAGQPGVVRLACGQRLPQQRHPHRPGPTDRGGHGRGRAAVGHQADPGERQQERRRLGWPRPGRTPAPRAADPGSHPVRRRPRPACPGTTTARTSRLARSRLVTSKCSWASVPDRSAPELNAPPAPGHQHHADVVARRRALQLLGEPVGHRGGHRVELRRPVEGQAQHSGFGAHVEVVGHARTLEPALRSRPSPTPKEVLDSEAAWGVQLPKNYWTVSDHRKEQPMQIRKRRPPQDVPRASARTSGSPHHDVHRYGVFVPRSFSILG